MRRGLILVLVLLVAGLPAWADSPLRHAGVDRIVAFADVHGAYPQLVSVLRETAVVDDSLHWRAGATHLVSLGDLLDRGAESRKVLDLLMRLESEARAAGGAVHVVLGNHEVMNMVGETRDASPEIFASFGGEDATREAFGPRGRYGKWLRSKPVIAKVETSVFMHAGVDPAFSDASLNDINQRVRRELSEWDAGVRYLVDQKLIGAAPKLLDAVEAARKEQERLLSSPTRHEPDVQRNALLLAPLVNIGYSSLFAPNGPMWFRGFASWSDEEGGPKIDALLTKFKAERFVTGHTPQGDGQIKERFGGKLFLIDTGMLGGRFFPKGQPSAVEITSSGVKTIYAN